MNKPKYNIDASVQFSVELHSHENKYQQAVTLTGVICGNHHDPNAPVSDSGRTFWYTIAREGHVFNRPEYQISKA